MKHLAALLLCFTVNATPIRAIDGDTFVADIDVWIGLKSRDRVRVVGINAPETKGATREAGLASWAFTTEWLALGDLTLFTCGKDSFGRILAEVTRGHTNLGNELVALGLAKKDRK